MNKDLIEPVLKILYFSSIGIFAIVILISFFYTKKQEYKSSFTTSQTLNKLKAPETEEILPAHIKTPKEVKAFYMSSWVVGTKNMRDAMIKIVEETELNSVVIDVKDNFGVISWQGRVKDEDLREFIKSLHKKNIYVIARIAAFQDPIYAEGHKSEAIQNLDGSIWKTKSGEKWVDPASRSMWDYLLNIADEAYERGFDEINFDYIRYSVDDRGQKLIYPRSGEYGVNGREKIIGDFYKYVTDDLRTKNIPVSGDVFGIITTSKSDIYALGQNLHTALKHFDYVAPMVYPSHYAPNTFGFKNPAANPKGVILASMQGAIDIAKEMASSTGTTSDIFINKLRPWYQDFDMGATYTAEMVKAQIEAGESIGIKSWMLWDPSNKYTKAALDMI